MIRHLLLITFRPATSDERIDAVFCAFLRLAQTVPGILHMECGENNSTEGLNAGFTHCVQMTFRNEVARQNYLVHPAHEALKQLFCPLTASLIVIDYCPDRAE